MTDPVTDMQERVARLDAMIAEGRILRGAWTDGHERACLLAALSPEAGEEGLESACPAEVMPGWLAYMTPWLDDSTSAEAWPGLVRRYASLARRWSVLDADAWERARIASLIAIVSEARSHCPPSDTRVLDAIDGALDWLRRGAPEAEREAVAAATRTAVAVATKASSAAAYAARWAASGEAEARASVATLAASSAAAYAARWAARWAAADRIAAAVLDAIEAEIERDE